MHSIEVSIEQLPPMRVAAALGYGQNPENEAWKKLLKWARKMGLFSRLHEHRFFGFDRPGPGGADPNYGYEQWMTVSCRATASEDIEIKESPGGTYAVTHCRFADLVQTWQDFVTWREDSRFHYTDDHCLEEVIAPWMMVAYSAGEPVNMDDVPFILYLPVTE